MGGVSASGSDEGGSANRFRSRWWVLGLVVVAVAVAILLLSQGGGNGGPLNAIAAAAASTEHEPGGRTTSAVIVTSPDGTRIKMEGTSVFDDAGRASGSLNFTDPKSGNPVQMRYVGDGPTIYMSSSMFGSLPGGAKWMKLDLPPGKESNAPVPPSSDATQGLKLLESADDVEKLGQEPVRGVSTTHYRGKLGAAGRPMEVEVWIDGEGRIRRRRLVSSGSNDKGERSPKIDMRTDFLAFGSTPHIQIPDPSEVFDGTSLAESATSG